MNDLGNIYRISIIDFLKIDDKILNNYNSNFACYTGIVEHSIPLGTSFKYLYDRTNPSVVLEGSFTIKYIEILSKPSENLISGYNAVLFMESNVAFEEISKTLELNTDGNVSNVHELFNSKP